MSKAIKKIVKPVASIAAPIAGFALGGPAGAAFGGGLGGLLGGGGLSGALSGAALGGIGGAGAQALGLQGGQGFSGLLGNTALGRTLGLSPQGMGLGGMSGNILSGVWDRLGGMSPAGGSQGLSGLFGGGGGLGSLSGGLLDNLMGGGGQQAQSGGLGGLLGNLSLTDLLVGGGSLGSGIYAANVAKDASKDQIASINEAIRQIQNSRDQSMGTISDALAGAQDRLYQADNAATATMNDQMGYLSPYAQAGDNALGLLSGLATGGTDPNRFIQNNPAYQFRLQQGLKALENSAAARGGLFSGATGKALQDYGQGAASQEFDNAYNRLASLASMGQQVAGQKVGIRGQAGNAYDTTLRQLANNRLQGANMMSGLTQQSGGALADLMRTRGDAVATGKVAGANAYQDALGNFTQYATARRNRGLFG